MHIICAYIMHIAYVHKQTHLNTCTITHKHIHMHNIYKHTHNIHTYIHMYTYIQTYIYTYVHTYVIHRAYTHI